MVKKYSEETLKIMSNKKLGEDNPMFGKPKSSEFIYWSTKDRTGENNPMYGKSKSIETLKKLRKPVYYFNVDTPLGKKLIGQYEGLLIASKAFLSEGINKTTLKRYIDQKKPHKGIIYSYKSELELL